MTAEGREKKKKPALFLTAIRLGTGEHTYMHPHVQATPTLTHTSEECAHKPSEHACQHSFRVSLSLALIDNRKPSAAPSILHVTLATEQGQPQKLKTRNRAFGEDAQPEHEPECGINIHTLTTAVENYYLHNEACNRADTDKHL